MAKVNVRNPIAVCSFTAVLVACAIIATIFHEQVQADPVVGQCDGTTVTYYQYCTLIHNCQPVGQCISFNFTCDGGCGPDNQECARANFTNSVLVGQCYNSLLEAYSCTSCSPYWCAGGSAYTGISSDGTCINYKCGVIYGVTNGCIPPS